MVEGCGFPPLAPPPLHFAPPPPSLLSAGTTPPTPKKDYITLHTLRLASLTSKCVFTYRLSVASEGRGQLRAVVPPPGSDWRFLLSVSFTLTQPPNRTGQPTLKRSRLYTVRTNNASILIHKRLITATYENHKMRLKGPEKASKWTLSLSNYFSFLTLLICISMATRQTPCAS